MNAFSLTADAGTYKGDLHIHTTDSDGRDTPDAMLDRLTACGFDFCCLADHDQPGVSGERRGILVLQGQEASAENGHIVVLSSSVVRDPRWSTAEQLGAFGASGALTILSHPKIREFTSSQGPTYGPPPLLEELAGRYDGIEIYTHNVGSGPRLAIDRLDVIWSAALLPWGAHSERRFKPVWAFGSSDAHDVAHVVGNVGIVVWAEGLSEAGILAAIRDGAFYVLAHTQARFSELLVDGQTLSVSATSAVVIRVIAIGGNPVHATAGDGTAPLRLAYAIRGDEGYLRVEAMDAGGQCAYSNPVLIERHSPCKTSS